MGYRWLQVVTGGYGWLQKVVSAGAYWGWDRTVRPSGLTPGTPHHGRSFDPRTCRIPEHAQASAHAQQLKMQAKVLLPECRQAGLVRKSCRAQAASRRMHHVRQPLHFFVGAKCRQLIRTQESGKGSWETATKCTLSVSVYALVGTALSSSLEAGVRAERSAEDMSAYWNDMCTKDVNNFAFEQSSDKFPTRSMDEQVAVQLQPWCCPFSDTWQVVLPGLKMRRDTPLGTC